MKRLVLIAALALSACAHKPPVKPEVVKVPVPVPCVSERPQRPATPVVSEDDGLFVRVQKLLATVEALTGYTGELEAVVSACD